MSRTNKLRNKAQAKKSSSNGGKGPSGTSRVPGHQAAPPWVKDGKRVPKQYREMLAKREEERLAAAREAAKQSNAAKREAAHAE